MITDRIFCVARDGTRSAFTCGRAVVVAALMLALPGCLGSSLNEANYLHNPADFTVVQQAKETAEKVDYLAGIKQEREVQARILKRELAVVDHFATARRNFELLNISGTDGVKSAELEERINARGAELFGTKKPTLKNITTDQMTEGGRCGEGLIDPAEGTHRTVTSWIVAQLASIEGCREELLDVADRYAGVLRFSPPPCPTTGEIMEFDDIDSKDVKALIKKYKNAHPTQNFTDERIKADIRREHENYRKRCLDVRTHQRASTALMSGCNGTECGERAGEDAQINGLGGLLAEAASRLNNAEIALRQDKKEAKSAEKDYSDAVDEYKEAVKAHAQQPSSETKKTLEEKGKQVKDTLDKLGKAGGVIGVDFLSDEQIAGIDTILEAISAGTYDADELAKACKQDDQQCAAAQASAVAASLPGFIDRAKFIRSLSEAPPLSGLILEKARLLAQQQNAKKAIGRRNREIKELKSIFDARVAEASQLLRAEQLLNSAQEKQDAGDNDEARALRLRAVAAYLQTFTEQRRAVNAAEYRLVALQHEAALDYSETSLNIWESAIETPVAALYAYYEGGLKPEDIVELLKSLALIGIAVGVN